MPFHIRDPWAHFCMLPVQLWACLDIAVVQWRQSILDLWAVWIAKYIQQSLWPYARAEYWTGKKSVQAGSKKYMHTCMDSLIRKALLGPDSNGVLLKKRTRTQTGAAILKTELPPINIQHSISLLQRRCARSSISSSAGPLLGDPNVSFESTFPVRSVAKKHLSC